MPRKLLCPPIVLKKYFSLYFSWYLGKIINVCFAPSISILTSFIQRNKIDIIAFNSICDCNQDWVVYKSEATWDDNRRIYWQLVVDDAVRLSHVGLETVIDRIARCIPRGDAPVNLCIFGNGKPKNKKNLLTLLLANKHINWITSEKNMCIQMKHLYIDRGTNWIKVTNKCGSPLSNWWRAVKYVYFVLKRKICVGRCFIWKHQNMSIREILNWKHVGNSMFTKIRFKRFPENLECSGFQPKLLAIFWGTWLVAFIAMNAGIHSSFIVCKYLYVFSCFGRTVKSKKF